MEMVQNVIYPGWADQHGDEIHELPFYISEH